MAFWGTLNSSLFIVSLNNILAHDPSEEKAFFLLERLEKRDSYKSAAIGMFRSAFRAQKYIKSKGGPHVVDRNDINVKMFKRDYVNFSKIFSSVRK
jgi:hypothetical protein